MKDQITFADFAKLDLRVGEILEANAVEGSEKLVELKVNIGPPSPAASERLIRTIYAGIKKWYEPSSLVGRKLMFVVNLAPKKFKIGDCEYESQGMLIASGQDEAILYSFDRDLPSGAVVR